MKRILIATDGSPAALQAVELGLELAEEHAAQVTFVHVAPAADVLPVAGFGMSPVSVPHEVEEADRASLDAALALAEERGIPALTRLLVGNAAKQIVAYADEIDADVIVVGSRGSARSAARCSAACRARCCATRSARCWSFATCRQRLRRKAAVSGSRRDNSSRRA